VQSATLLQDPGLTIPLSIEKSRRYFAAVRYTDFVTFVTFVTRFQLPRSASSILAWFFDRQHRKSFPSLSAAECQITDHRGPSRSPSTGATPPPQSTTRHLTTHIFQTRRCRNPGSIYRQFMQYRIHGTAVHADQARCATGRGGDHHAQRQAGRNPVSHPSACGCTRRQAGERLLQQHVSASPPAAAGRQRHVFDRVQDTQIHEDLEFVAFVA
jgi:hypothetical protein